MDIIDRIKEVAVHFMFCELEDIGSVLIDVSDWDDDVTYAKSVTIKVIRRIKRRKMRVNN